MTDRPDYCCGKCPEIVGGGYDCTCRGNPRCETYEKSRHCPVCGRFMKRGGYYSNDHDDSWEETWKCAVRHPTPAQVQRSRELAEEAQRKNRQRQAAEQTHLFLASLRAINEKEGAGA